MNSPSSLRPTLAAWSRHLNRNGELQGILLAAAAIAAAKAGMLVMLPW